MKLYRMPFSAIIVVPLQEILENVFRLLSRPPTCQSRLACSVYQKHF